MLAAIAGLALSVHAPLHGQTADTPQLHRADLRASTFALSSQAETDVAVAEDGGFLAAWSSRRQNGGKYGVFAQRFDARGVSIGEEFCLGAWRESHQLSPALATTDSGLTWAVWQSHGQDGEAGAIIARLFDTREGGSAGDEAPPASGEILVNQIASGHQSNPVIAPMPGGGAAIAWESQDANGVRQVRYRLFDASGYPLTDEVAVGGSGAHGATPSIASATHGVAIAWSAFDIHTGEPMGVRVRTFGVDGSPLGETLAPAGPAMSAMSQVEPVIASTADGYVLAWIDGVSDEDSYGVLAVRLDAAGGALGRSVVVNTETRGVQNAPAIAVRQDGTIAIAFNSDVFEDESPSAAPGRRAVHARLFEADLAPLGESFALSETADGDRTLREAAGTRRLAFTPSGELLCAWSGASAGSAGLGSDGSSANITMLSERELAPAMRGVQAEMCAAPFAQNTDMAAGPHIPPTFDPLRIAEAGERTVITEEGIGFLAISNTGWTPPDPHMAVGQNHIVAITNGEIAFFNKADGTNTFRDEIEDSFGFWGPTGVSDFVFDPEALYDPAEDRFVVMASESFAPGNRSYVLVAVSDDGDPNGTWHKFRLETTSLAGDFFDSPNIAVTDDAVIVTGDGFGLGANYPVFAYDKASLYAVNPPAITRQTTLSTSTQSAGIPPFSQAPDNILYMVEHQEGNNRTRLRLIALEDSLTSPSFTTTLLTVPSYGAPGDPAQAGTGVRPETFDARFWSAVYVDGTLWATHHVSNPVRARWYEIDLRGWPNSGNSPTLAQSGEIQPDAGTFTFFSSIAANADGLAAVCYAQSASDEFISMRTAHRLPGDPPGTMRLGDAQQTATGPYTQSRWGDYSAADIDPADNSTIWSHHEYAIGNSWRTWIASILTESGCPADLDGDGDADADDFFDYLDAFAAGDLDICDIDGDGDCDADDFLDYLDLFAQGC